MTDRKRLSAWAPVVVALVFVFTASAAEPPLSDRVRAVIAEKGVKGAREELPILVVGSMGKTESDEKGMLALAEEYLEEGNIDAAELVVSLQMIVGNSAAVAVKQGEVYSARGVPLAAAMFYQQALSLDPDNEDAKSGLALVNEKHPEVQSFLNPQTKPEPTVKPADTAEKKTQAVVNPDPPPRTQGGGDTLLPYVVVTDPDKAATVDWAALRKQAGTRYPSRWDDLTLVDSCLWISPEELQERLGLTARLDAKKIDFQCKYRVHLSNGDSTVVLSVYAELHSAEQARKNELSFSEGISGSQFTPFYPGASDLKVYVNEKSKYLYVFPSGGRTMWRLGYRGDSVDPERFRRESGLDPDLGPRFLRLLVEKYGGRL
jgi:tetratricopeptide (TPR) repeat protein